MNKKDKWLFLLGLILVFNLNSGNLFGQILINGSFEGPAGQGKVPEGWNKCHRFSTPDTQPGAFEVTKKASEGATFIGLVTRGNLGPYANNNEDIETKLLKPLLQNQPYSLSLDLSYSKKWGHGINFDASFLFYTTPAKLTIYGGKESCLKSEILYTSPIIDHEDWRSYDIILEPQNSDVDYLIFEATWESNDKTYFGNVLIDNIVMDPCPFADPIIINTYDTLICKEDTVILDASFPGGVYQWSNGSTKPSIKVSSEGTFSVLVKNTCMEEEFNFLVLEKECNCIITAPNVITPNGDGLNDDFILETPSVMARFNLNIYNRLGELVFQTDQAEEYWDGKLNGNELPSGVYFWEVDMMCIKGQKIEDYNSKGWVSIVK